MLKSLDVLIGLVVIMLALSMAVTLITQAVTSIVNSRGRHLRRGLSDLLQQLDPGLDAGVSKAIATHVLTHPLVSGSSGPAAPLRRLGNVIHREEFTKLLLALAAGQGTANLETTARDSLKAALQRNGIDHPDETLKNVRTLAMELERTHADLSHGARQTIAVLREARSDLVAKINGWFDQTMDRTSQRFTASTRLVTFGGALLVAVGLQLDTPQLVNRLAADDTLRDALVQKAIVAQQADAARAGTEHAGTTNPATPPASSGPASPAAGAEVLTPEQQKIAQDYYAFLAENGIIRLPSAGFGSGWTAWWRAWLSDLKSASPLGLLLTALLLSLGAPFWYSMLGRLLQLRSVIAAKDDAQRTRRQHMEPADRGTPASRTLVVAAERGDIPAVS